jgi:hypothetical protein
MGEFSGGEESEYRGRVRDAEAVAVEARQQADHQIRFGRLAICLDIVLPFGKISPNRINPAPQMLLRVPT